MFSDSLEPWTPATSSFRPLLEVLSSEADGQEPRSVVGRVVDPLLEAEDVRVEVEPLSWSLTNTVV